MSLQKQLGARKQRRKFRTRNKFKSVGIKPRVSVYRSLGHIYAQIIDDKLQRTLLSCSSRVLKGAKGDKTAVAKQVGLELGRLAKEKSIEVVYFDRGGYLYHGRVSALAQGLRESGLQF
ncbi:50S ribosomal protein L18 [Candidatus Babeliales bacterium]|nr:50S ribosomal protein L18 [Candidatus Babeliales bacterium]